MVDQDVSFDPDEAQEGGGGIIQAASGAVLTFECVTYDYNGSVAVPVPAIHVHGEYKDESGEDATFDEYYSAGDATKLRPKKDGTAFQAISEGAGLTKTCKAMQLLSSLVSANGGDKSILTGNIKDLDGIDVDVERKPDIDRPGLATKGGRGRTILLVTSINAQPGEAKPKKAKGGAPAGKGKAAAKPSGKANIKAKAIEAVNKVIADAGADGIAVGDLPQAVFRMYKKDVDVKQLTELAGDEDFLSDPSTPWGYDGTTLTAGE